MFFFVIVLCKNDFMDYLCKLEVKWKLVSRHLTANYICQ